VIPVLQDKLFLFEFVGKNLQVSFTENADNSYHLLEDKHPPSSVCFVPNNALAKELLQQSSCVHSVGRRPIMRKPEVPFIFFQH
jgi:hypothetical protein